MLIAFLFYLFIAISVIDIIHLGLYLVGANYYDIRQFKRLASAAQRNHHELRPLVSVLIPAHNEELGVARCLDSVRKNTYRKLEIIVVDDASTDNTRKLVRQYIAKHPGRNIRLMYKRKNVGKAEALNHVLRHGAKGDLIMTLDADSVLHKKAVTNAVSYFDDPKVVGVAANVRIMDSLTVLGLLQKFEHMIGYRSKKFFAVTNSEYIIGGVASTYRRGIIKQVGYYDHDTTTEDIGLSLKIVARGNKEYRIMYAADVLAMTEGVQNFKALMRQRYRWKLGGLQNLIKHRDLVANTDQRYSRGLTFYRMPMAFFGELMLLLEPLAIGYVIYVCWMLATPSMIIGAYMTITLYLLLNLWPDEHMSRTKKIQMSLMTPIMYFVFYLMNFVQLVAIMRCLINHKQALGHTQVSSSWVSPKRRGEAQVQFS
ncbi:MAG TPA: glycosyltransferase family 2 protein [Candidatus Saccharimonadales bacterium]|nr:glycosyltransferase family 2 protein [Candidatus Saccharimonadales bacterium]